MRLKFFTDKSVDNDFLLIKMKDYLGLKDKTRWKEVLIDPGVYELVKKERYSWEEKVDVWEFLDSLPSNHFFSFDYPPDMNKDLEDLFIKKTWENAQRYHVHPQYICTVQFRFNNYMDFVAWFNKYNDLDIASGFLGLGNLCRVSINKSEFVKHALDYAFSHCRHPRIHVYGLGFRYIKQACKLARRFKIELSIDSTKWTRAIEPLRSKLDHYQCRGKEERELFFKEYLKRIQELGIKLVNEF